MSWNNIVRHHADCIMKFNFRHTHSNSLSYPSPPPPQKCLKDHIPYSTPPPPHPCGAYKLLKQCTKKVVSDSPGLVDFAIGLVNSVLNLPNGQVKYFEEFNLQKKCEVNSAHQKVWGLVEMTLGHVNASFSLPDWQAVKMTFFASCEVLN